MHNIRRTNNIVTATAQQKQNKTMKSSTIKQQQNKEKQKNSNEYITTTTATPLLVHLATQTHTAAAKLFRRVYFRSRMYFTYFYFYFLNSYLLLFSYLQYRNKFSKFFNVSLLFKIWLHFVGLTSCVWPMKWSSANIALQFSIFFHRQYKKIESKSTNETLIFGCKAISMVKMKQNSITILIKYNIYINDTDAYRTISVLFLSICQNISPTLPDTRSNYIIQSAKTHSWWFIIQLLNTYGVSSTIPKILKWSVQSPWTGPYIHQSIPRKFHRKFY